MRPTKDKYFLEIASVVATRATCSRRSVGCVVVDDHYRILSTGHNGVPPGAKHCTENPCPGSSCKSGQGLDMCRATHAEINALLFCSDIKRVSKIYVTTCPCMQCIKAIATSGCKEIIYTEAYDKYHALEVKDICDELGIRLRQI